MKQIKHLSLEKRKVLSGYLFSLPFLLGFLLFFLYPFIQSFMFSINELELTRDGFALHFNGLANYSYAINIHPQFIRVFVTTIGNMLINVPLVLAFSFFAAMILNQKFKGRFLARLIFFLPVIMGAGIIIQMDTQDMISQLMQGARNNGLVITGAGLRHLLMNTQLPAPFINFILAAVQRIPEIIKESGIQILIFLAGLQSIPPSIYEAAGVEGATKWESFWLITLPMLSPIILTNGVYTIINNFMTPANEVVMMIKDEAFGGAGYGVSMAMAVMYFLTILVLLAITIRIASKHVFYQE